MINSIEFRLAPAVLGMKAFIEPFHPWMEKVLGCSISNSAIFEVANLFGQLAAEDLLKGVALDRQCLLGADAIRPAVLRWELPPGVSPRIGLTLSRNQNSPITSKELAWNPHWMEAPVAVWLQGLVHPIVAVSIPYVSFANGLQPKWNDWMVVNRSEIAATLNMLRALLANCPKQISVFGGNDIPLTPGGCDWDSIVLDARVSKMVRDDFEFFFQHEAWFKRVRIPFRRGYLFYGPPGNGKTSAIKVMASHPGISAFTLDFSNEEVHNGALTELFNAACHAAPSLVIFEDLDRLYGKAPEEQTWTRITLQHLLNCLDGLGSQDGTIVVATANDPSGLDPSILRRPGRFDRIVPFRPPSAELRREYLRRLMGAALGNEALVSVANEATGCPTHRFVRSMLWRVSAPTSAGMNKSAARIFWKACD